MGEVRRDFFGSSVPVEQVRQAVADAGLTHRELAELLGWRDSRDRWWDQARVRRTLGLDVNYQTNKRYPPRVASVVYNKTARRIYEAIERAREHPPERPAPPDVSGVPESTSAWRCRGCGKWSHAKVCPAWHKRVEQVDGGDRMVRCGPFDAYVTAIEGYSAKDVFSELIPGTEREWHDDPNEGIGVAF